MSLHNILFKNPLLHEQFVKNGCSNGTIKKASIMSNWAQLLTGP
jgi:hypothetical protein